MKNVIKSALLLALLAGTFGCPKDPPAEPPKPVEPVKPPEPVKPTVPDYAPTGDMADVMKEAAKDINVDNAAMKATEVDMKLDGAIKTLEEAKAAKDAKKTK